jgi:glutathione S-transferase
VVAFNKELIQKGGKKQVPCLKIIENGQESWLYESGDIIKYLNKIT